jgi:site-specific DNA recombinase
MMQAAIYVRVSTEDQVSGYSIPTQIERCQEKAREFGAEVRPEHVFVDDGYSGASLDRPALNSLRSLVASRGCDAVLVYDADRLSRRLVDLLVIEDEFRACGAQLHIVNSPLDPSDEGWLFFQIRGAFAEFERRKLLERTQRGKRGRAKAGYPLGGRPPFGYRYESDGGHRGWYVIDPVQAQVVRRVFAWCVEGVPLRNITLRLSQMGAATSLGRAQWSKASVHRILSYEGYTGSAYYNKTRRAFPRKPSASRPAKNTPVARPRDEWIPLAIPVIIDRETFEAAQHQLELNRLLAKRNSKHEYLLRARLFCGRCGSRMVGTPVHGKRFYRCGRRHSALVERCKAGLLHADRAERAIWNEVYAILSRPALIAEEARVALEDKEHRATLFEHEFEIIEGVVKDCDRRQNQLLDLYLADALDIPAFKARSEELKTRKDAALARRAELEKLLERSRGTLMALSALEEYMGAVKRRLGSLSSDEQLMALAALDIQVTWTGEVLEMRGVVPACGIASAPSS